MATSSSSWSRLRWPIKVIIIAVPLLALAYFAAEQGLFDKQKAE